MVVNFDSSRFSNDLPAAGAWSIRRSVSQRSVKLSATGRPSKCLTIGLLNNMAGAAFKATERQFVSLLDSASEGIPIHVSFYTLPGLSPAESGGQQFAGHYANAESLLNSQLDALIVTGREPKMVDLRDEPYWRSFTHVLEWARTNTYSTVWSCLAAHAAILHMDGINRRKSKEKNFGVFNCMQVSESPLTQGLPDRFQIPHSRWNGVAKSDLIESGYTVLSRIDGDGVDMFTRQEQSLFVFLQGHPEYGTNTLMREYRRDVGRFFKGEMETYPLVPHAYFDLATEKTLAALREKAISSRSREMLGIVSAALEHTGIKNTWHRPATRFYKNWLEMICARKKDAQRNRHSRAAISISQ